MEQFGRLALATILCGVLYYAARGIWDFPLDGPTYWFASLYGLAGSIIVSACKK